MSFRDEVEVGVEAVFGPSWSRRDGTVVPTSSDVVLRDGAVDLDATYLYADLADSSALAQTVKDHVAAKIVRGYLNSATRILRHYGGQIRSFDGDRVLAIFVGTAKNTNAVRSALAINWAVKNVLTPKLLATWTDLESYWTPGHGIGVDTGAAMLVRGGVREHNDLISIGAAPNVAAKLSSIRDSASIYITQDVYTLMNESTRTAESGESMWRFHRVLPVGGHSYRVYSSDWWWAP